MSIKWYTVGVQKSLSWAISHSEKFHSTIYHINHMYIVQCAASISLVYNTYNPYCSKGHLQVLPHLWPPGGGDGRSAEWRHVFATCIRWDARRWGLGVSWSGNPREPVGTLRSWDLVKFLFKNQEMDPFFFGWCWLEHGFYDFHANI
jgi:hypothetical protein